MFSLIWPHVDSISLRMNQAHFKDIKPTSRKRQGVTKWNSSLLDILLCCYIHPKFCVLTDICYFSMEKRTNFQIVWKYAWVFQSCSFAISFAPQTHVYCPKNSLHEVVVNECFFLICEENLLLNTAKEAGESQRSSVLLPTTIIRKIMKPGPCQLACSNISACLNENKVFTRSFQTKVETFSHQQWAVRFCCI